MGPDQRTYPTIYTVIFVSTYHNFQYSSDNFFPIDWGLDGKDMISMDNMAGSVKGGTFRRETLVNQGCREWFVKLKHGGNPDLSLSHARRELLMQVKPEGQREQVDWARGLYKSICDQKITDGELGARMVRELEKITGKDFKNTEEFHLYVSEYLKKKGRVQETLGKRLAKARRKRGVSQVDLSKILGVDVRTARRWESDKQTPSQEALQWLNGEK